MKKLLLTLIAAITILPSVGRSQSSSLPIYSVGVAVSQNQSLIHSINGGYGAPSTVETNGLNSWFNVPYDPQGVPDPNAIIALIRAQQLAFKPVRPSNDVVYANLSLRSEEYDNLFSDASSFKLERRDGKWVIPTGKNKMNLELGDYTIIYEPGVYAATLVLRDKMGQILDYINVDVNYNYKTKIGKILYPTRYLEQHGELLAYYGQTDEFGNITNIYSAAFDTDTDGRLLNPSTVTANLDAGFSQLKVMSPPSIVLTNIPSSDGVGFSPLIVFTITNAQSITIQGKTTEGENAVGFKLKKLVRGQNNPFVPYTLPVGGPGALFLEPAMYQLDFDFVHLRPAQIYPWWYYGYGLGEKTVVVGGLGDEK